MKLKIAEDFRKKSGIYIIKNSINKKIYIGSAVCLQERFRGHRKAINKGTHKNPILQSFYNKYKQGSELEFHLLEIVNDKNDLLKAEQWWLDTLKPFDDDGFNILRKAGSSLGVKRSKESVEKWKKSMSCFKREKGRKRDLSSRLNMSKAQKNWIPVAQYSLDGKFLKVFDSAYMASISTKINRTKISCVCRFKRDTAGGFLWRHAPSYICPYRIEKAKNFLLIRRDIILKKSLNNEILIEYKSINDAVKDGFKSKYIRRACLNKNRSYCGFLWEYKV